MWDTFLDAASAQVLHERHESNARAARRFGPREDYAYTNEARAALEPGRARLDAVMRCKKKLLAKLALPPERGGHGIQVRAHTYDACISYIHHMCAHALNIECIRQRVHMIMSRSHVMLSSCRTNSTICSISCSIRRY